MVCRPSPAGIRGLWASRGRGTIRSMAKKQAAAEAEEDLATQVDRVLEEIRPYIHSHGGEVNVIEITDEGIARLQMVGSCNGCPMSMLTMRLGIERLLADKLPQLKGAEAVFVDDFEWPEIEAEA
jgi:Fe-S cluster biogenesis protein NfuA